MAPILEVVKRIFRPYSTYIMITLLVIVFSIAAYFIFKKYYIKKLVSDNKKYTDVANAEKRSKEVVIYFFNVDWCPHCKTAKPEWEKFASSYDGKEKGEYVIKCVNFNCTDENADVAKIINRFNIDSYPTIKMVKDNQTIEFDSKITEYTLEQFVNTMV
uniref:Thioredoxin domain-containing protein n=1 Tax=viral metagenome TaxID=1070528 RepID=A0A6C0KFG3_9ZZZZ